MSPSFTSSSELLEALVLGPLVAGPAAAVAPLTPRPTVLTA